MFKPVVVIPVYNHPQVIPAVLKQVLTYGIDCILVNDGSEESCSQLLRTLAEQNQDLVTLVEHQCNQGKGAAVTTGLGAAINAGYSHALQVDADGQHELSDIPKFLKIAQKQPAAIICGYPQYDTSVPKGRLYGRYLTHIWVWINTISLRIKDAMCGFRVYPLAQTQVVWAQKMRAMRMGWDVEVLVRSDWAQIPVINVKTRVHYPEDGVSHFQVLRDNILISRMHAVLFFGMLLRLPKLLMRSMTDQPKYDE